MFTDVPNLDLAPNDYSQLPASYDHKNLGNLYKIIPVANRDSIKFSWVINESFQKNVDSKPSHYVSHLLGHQGPNSVLSLLKNQNLAMDLVTYCGQYYNTFDVMNCKITLTKKGLEQWKRVVQIVYQYIQNIRSKGPQRWLFQEIKTVEETNFRFKSKQNFIDYVSSLSNYMQKLEPQQMHKILVSRCTISEYGADEIMRILNRMRLENSNIYLMSRSFEDQCKSEQMRVQKWYQTKFWKYQFQDSLKQKILKANLQKQLSQKLDFPPKNIFISDKFDLLENPYKQPYPQLVSIKNGSQLWFLQDHQFKMPKASIGVKIYTNDNEINTQINGRLFLAFFSLMLNQNMNEFNYMADMGSLAFAKSQRTNNFDLTFDGYNQSLKTYVIEVMKRIAAYKPEIDDKNQKQAFSRVRQKLIRQYKNQDLLEGYQQAIKKLDAVLNKNIFEAGSKIKLLEDENNINYQWFVTLRKKFLTKAHFVWFVAGNYSKEDGKYIQEQCQKILGFSHSIEKGGVEEEFKLSNKFLKRQDISQVFHIKIPDNQYLIYEKEHGNKQNVNSTLLSYFQRLPKSNNLNDEQIGKVLFQIIQQPFFSKLRTQEQLGYIVFSGFYQLRNIPGARFIIQSPVGSPQFLASRIDQFLINFRKENLQSLTQQDINKYKDAAITQAIQKDLSIKKEFTRQFQEIKNHEYLMDRKEKVIEILKKDDVVTRQSLIQYFNDLFLESTGVRRLDIQIVSSFHKEDQKQWRDKRNSIAEEKFRRNYFGGDNEQTVQSLEMFKKNSEVFPDLIKAKWIDYYKSSKL